MTTGRTPRIAIVGGGIGGLALAAFLSRAGLSATVYEQAPALKEVGAGIVVPPNSVRLLRRLGIMDAFQECALQLQVAWEFRRWQNGEVISEENLVDACERLYGEGVYGMHRADLLTVIKAAVPQERVRLGMRCTAVQVDSGGARLTFADGCIDEVDIVIGADGIHSIVRGAITETSPPVFSGMTAFRAIVAPERASEFARRPAHAVWLGPGRHVVHYPVAGGRINLFAATPAGDWTEESWSATATVEEFLAEFEGWDAHVTDLIRAADVPGRWALLEHPPLHRWSFGRGTLLGDAAHPMLPFYAQGAAQSIEDAATLAFCLSQDIENCERALQTYETLRRERATSVQQASHSRASVNHLPDGPEQEARDASLRVYDPLVSSGWIYGHDAEAVAGRTG